MIAAVIGDIVIAIPTTSGTRQTRMYRYEVWRPTPRNNSRPPATRPIPNATARFAPKRAVMRGVSGATMIMIGAIGSSRSAVDNGEYSRTSWKYCVMRNITPNSAMKTRIMPPVPVLNAGLRK